MANLEPMPISSLPEGDIQDGDKAIIYRESTGKAYQTGGFADLQKEVDELNADLTNKAYFSTASTIDGLCEDINALPRYSPCIFGSGETAGIASALSNGATSSACRGFAIKMAANDNYFDFFMFSANGRIAYFGRYNNGLTSLTQLNTSTVTLSSVGDPVVMGED